MKLCYLVQTAAEHFCLTASRCICGVADHKDHQAELQLGTQPQPSHPQLLYERSAWRGQVRTRYLPVQLLQAHLRCQLGQRP